VNRSLATTLIGAAEAADTALKPLTGSPSPAMGCRAGRPRILDANGANRANAIGVSLDPLHRFDKIIDLGSTIRFPSITRDYCVNAVGWIRLRFARFASPEFSKQERVSGLSAVSAAPRFARGQSYLMSLALRARSCSLDYPGIL